MNSETHIIHRQIVELQASSAKCAEDAQAVFAGLWVKRLEAMVEGLLSERSVPGELRVIDRLELDLGVLDFPRMEEQILERAEDVLREALSSAGSEHPNFQSAGGIHPPSMARVLHFLSHGTLPWWSPSVDTATLASELDEILIDGAGLSRAWLMSEGRDPRVAVRVTQQFGAERALALLAVLTPEFAAWMREVIDVVRTSEPVAQGGFPSGGPAPLLRLAWEAWFETTSTGEPRSYAMEEAQAKVLRSLPRQARQKLAGPDPLPVDGVDQAGIGEERGGWPDEEKTQREFAERPKDREVRTTPPPASENEVEPATRGMREQGGAGTPMEHPTEGVAATRPDDEDWAAGQQKFPAPEAGMGNATEQGPTTGSESEARAAGQQKFPAPEAGMGNATEQGPTTGSEGEAGAAGRQGASPSAAEPESHGEHATAPARAEDTSPAAPAGSLPRIREGIPVANGGLVLVWPYLGIVFENVGLRAEGEWRNSGSPDRAVHLLQYIATGEEAAPEQELLLNKLLCGLEPAEPVTYELSLTDREKDEAETLLKTLIEHWSVLKGTSLTGLRQSFLQREGLVERLDQGWRLRVERKAYDMLMEQLPFGLGMVRLSWMPASIEVEW